MTEQHVPAQMEFKDQIPFKNQSVFLVLCIKDLYQLWNTEHNVLQGTCTLRCGDVAAKNECAANNNQHEPDKQKWKKESM